MPSTRTGRRKAGRDENHRLPSGAIPPPGTIMCTCGWCVIAAPHVWRTAVMPMCAPKCLRSAAIVSIVSDAALLGVPAIPSKYRYLQLLILLIPPSRPVLG